MGDVLAVDWVNKKYLGKVPQRQEALSLETPPEILLALYESSIGFVNVPEYVAPDKDPA